MMGRRGLGRAQQLCGRFRVRAPAEPAPFALKSHRRMHHVLCSLPRVRAAKRTHARTSNSPPNHSPMDHPSLPHLFRRFPAPPRSPFPHKVRQRREGDSIRLLGGPRFGRQGAEPGWGEGKGWGGCGAEMTLRAFKRAQRAPACRVCTEGCKALQHSTLRR
jgi:hypothetical protein